MLSSILSRLFWLAFILLFIFGLANITGQIRQKPIIISTGKNSYTRIGQHGIRITAFRRDSWELQAPDTLVEYTMLKKDSSSNNGNFHLKKDDFFDGRAELDELIREEKSMGYSLLLDTQVNIILHQEWDTPIDEKDQNSFSFMKGTISYNTSSASFETLPDGSIRYKKTWLDNNGRKNKVDQIDTFKTLTEAQIFSITHSKKQPVKISQEGIVKETLKILPGNTSQHIMFVVLDLLNFTCLVILMLLLSKLFRNFSRHYYFTQQNVQHLSLVGWCLLIPQLILTLFYWGFLIKIHPVKIQVKSNEEVNAIIQYDILSGVEGSMVFLGLGILILSYIFKDGLKLKEEQTLTI